MRYMYFYSPLLVIGIEYYGLVCVIIVPLQLIAENTLTRVALKGPTHLLYSICHRHILRRENEEGRKGVMEGGEGEGKMEEGGGGRKKWRREGEGDKE